MKKAHLYGFSALSGILLSLGWPEIGGLSFLLFIAFLPLFAVEEEISNLQKQGIRKSLWPCSYTTFLVFNVLTTWWVWFASPGGSIAAMTINALFMAVIFQLFHFTKRVIGRKEGYISLILYWLAWEYIHARWDLTWPWLNLGNGFANYTSFIQWYEFTGAPGGTLWILAVNILLYHGIKYGFEQAWNQRVTLRFLFFSAVFLLVPIVTSIVLKASYEEQHDPIEIVVLQPNIDPYNEKFNELTSSEQVGRMVRQAQEALTSTTDYLVAPETAIPDALREDLVRNTQEYAILKSLVDEYPNLNIVIGASSIEVYGKQKPDSPTYRKSQSGMYYDYYNAALQINQDRFIPFYHKSKLVPGVERMPFPQLLRPLQESIFDLGGPSGSMGSQPEREVFYSASDSTAIAPVICYESVYGEFVGEYINLGADVIFVITNDGWWGDTPGYKQHLAYARLRAIEHRRSIARSANTGISCFINQVGEIQKATSWWEPDVIKAEINRNKSTTFYTRYGDYLSRTSALFSGFLLLLAILRWKTGSNKNE